MKKTLLIITALMLIVGCGSDFIKLDINNLIDRGGLMYAPNDDEPFTGSVFDFYDNGQRKFDGRYRKGLMHGKWTYYHENGQKMIEGTYKNLKLDGELTTWFENVQKSLEFNYELGDITEEEIVAEFGFPIYK
ncbi:MAG: hypothetical protein QGF98_06580, partial [Candidatus Poseidoniia archaeon]|nr:hypothetical protein [Candidatus Poseidoniia archaeon]